jgi:Holliday junction resolvasome RuvABC endonuclease subunit
MLRSGVPDVYDIIEPSGDFWARQHFIVNHLSSYIEDCDWVIFEKVRLFHGGKISLPAIEDLARLSGAIGYVAAQLDRKIDTVHTTHYRLRVLNNGKATKEDVIAWVDKTFGIQTKKSDVAEAIALAMYGELVHGTPKKAMKRTKRR